MHAKNILYIVTICIITAAIMLRSHNVMMLLRICVRANDDVLFFLSQQLYIVNNNVTNYIRSYNPIRIYKYLMNIRFALCKYNFQHIILISDILYYILY